jgi:hypothetical protein
MADHKTDREILESIEKILSQALESKPHYRCHAEKPQAINIAEVLSNLNAYHAQHGQPLESHLHQSHHGLNTPIGLNTLDVNRDSKLSVTIKDVIVLVGVSIAATLFYASFNSRLSNLEEANAHAEAKVSQVVENQITQLRVNNDNKIYKLRDDIEKKLTQVNDKAGTTWQMLRTTQKDVELLKKSR